jgi:hypothetical protein
MRKGNEHDPKGLVFESYRIDGITAGECRTIFLDWALSLPNGADPAPHITALLTQYGAAHADHPMTQVLKEGQSKAASPKRRGGRNGRRAAPEGNTP